MDYRLKENRLEGFIKFYAWSLKFGDVDPAVWMTKYLNKRYEHNIEQKIWFCWLYGTTYQLPTAWILFNEFPDFELVTLEKITKWSLENKQRLHYQTDTIQNKNTLPIMFESYKKNIGNITQQSWFEKHSGDNEEQTFDNLMKVICSDFYNFGRFITYYYLQHLNHTTNIKNEPSSLMLSDSGSESHRKGLLYALGMEEKINEKITKEEYADLEKIALEIKQEMKIRFPELIPEIDFFTMETALCAYKKLFRERSGRYLGYYIARQAMDIECTRKLQWPGIDWSVLYQSREECLDKRVIENVIDKTRYPEFLNYGNWRKLELMFDGEGINDGLTEFMF